MSGPDALTLSDRLFATELVLQPDPDKQLSFVLLARCREAGLGQSARRIALTLDLWPEYGDSEAAGLARVTGLRVTQVRNALGRLRRLGILVRRDGAHVIAPEIERETTVRAELARVALDRAAELGRAA